MTTTLPCPSMGSFCSPPSTAAEGRTATSPSGRGKITLRDLIRLKSVRLRRRTMGAPAARHAVRVRGHRHEPAYHTAAAPTTAKAHWAVAELLVWHSHSL